MCPFILFYVSIFSTVHLQPPKSFCGGKKCKQHKEGQKVHFSDDQEKWARLYLERGEVVIVTRRSLKDLNQLSELMHL